MFWNLTIRLTNSSKLIFSFLWFFFTHYICIFSRISFVFGKLTLTQRKLSTPYLLKFTYFTLRRKWTHTQLPLVNELLNFFSLLKIYRFLSIICRICILHWSLVHRWKVNSLVKHVSPIRILLARKTTNLINQFLSHSWRYASVLVLCCARSLNISWHLQIFIYSHQPRLHSQILLQGLCRMYLLIHVLQFLFLFRERYNFDFGDVFVGVPRQIFRSLRNKLFILYQICGSTSMSARTLTTLSMIIYCATLFFSSSWILNWCLLLQVKIQKF